MHMATSNFNANVTTSNTATTKSQTQEENHNISSISNATNSMPIPPPPINFMQNQLTMDDYLNAKLTLEEKRKLRYDLLSLQPEKLGEIMYVLQKSQPQNIVQIGDELEIDLKKLNTKTLRHLQRYVESVFAKVRYNSTQIQPVMVPQNIVQPIQQRMFVPNQAMLPQQQTRKLQLHDLMPTMDTRKRSFDAMNGFVIDEAYGRPQRKKRSAFTAKQKEQMIEFWKTVNWQAIPSDAELEEVGKTIGVTVPQLKVFRQNNRKKYGNESVPSSPNKSNSNTVQNENSNEEQKEINLLQPQPKQQQNADHNETIDNKEKQE